MTPTHFDSEIDHLAKKNTLLEVRLKMIDVLKAEKQLFLKDELIPWSEPMRTPLVRYFAANAEAEKKVKHVYDTLIVAQVKDKNENTAAALRASLSNLIPIRVLARWKSFLDGRFHHDLILYSNGRFDKIDGSSPWSYYKGVLDCRWSDAKAPGGIGFWKVSISADGKTYKGTDHIGKINLTGEYLQPP